MVQFTKIRLSGFKSFVDPTELLIEPGVTGVVGPNGCGKSNLLEGLKWAMGEGSAKQMRGGEMDDVIFGGTDDRPSRNLAEVTIYLDNSDRGAPAAYNGQDDIEIVRRIERGSGSHYRINGREARARDVQLLFADISTGPRSTAIVSQGRVGAIINAKPIQRRLLLEEAAGITGLHSRRHEAELRLKAAETNLERLDDVVAALEEQLAGLKRQARQAARYRSISDRIRKAEAVQLHLRWRTATDALEAARTRLKDAEAKVVEHTGHAASAAAAQAEGAADLPDLRREEAESSAQLHRLVVAREALDAEESRLQAAQQECETRLAQIAADNTREQELLDGALAAIERLSQEKSEIEEAQARQTEAEAEAADAVEAAEKTATAQEAELTEITEKVMAAEARRADIARRGVEIEERRAKLANRAASVAEELASIGDDASDQAAVTEVESRVVAAQGALDTARTEAEAAETRETEARQAETEARDALREAEDSRARLQAEIDGLSALLAVHAGKDDDGEGVPRTPVLDDLVVEPGYEDALGAALGDDLSAPASGLATGDADHGAPVHWRELPPLADTSPLPAGAEPLDKFVRAPKALARRLSHVGVVADAETGRALSGELTRGQRLVTRDGALWRWDGYTVRAGAAPAAAVRLAQRNRIAEASADLANAQSRTAAEQGKYDAARAAAEEAKAAGHAARESARRAFADLSTARDTQTETAQSYAANASRLAVLEESAERLAADLAEAESLAEAAREAESEARDKADDISEEREALGALREEVSALRTAHAECRQSYNRLQVEATGRQIRLDNITDELAAWSARAETGRDQLAQLAERLAGANEALGRLAARPKEIEAQRGELMDHVEAAETRRTASADKLAEAEARLAAIDTRLRQAETALADMREERGRCEGAVSQAQLALDTVVERIGERLDCQPAEALALAELKDGESLPDIESVDVRVERLIRERDNMGPVNLRAEQEAVELGEQIDTLESERADLMSAINRLRHGIGELNREGRERLLMSFKEVNTHFQELFVRLFGGGTAHLELTESDDPLEAGLEIMASPPGKKLQVMSLLSGGEQAMTALALLFAVFLTNPAPICVLDEVDAPLDESNVGRFCTMIDEIAHASQTRFLLITHHRMTMARMDRLFGVTMPERGVSQLVSVDLQRAESLRATG